MTKVAVGCACAISTCSAAATSAFVSSGADGMQNGCTSAHRHRLHFLAVD